MEIAVTSDTHTPRGRLALESAVSARRRRGVRPLAHPLHERSPDGFQIFAPGSPTERRRGSERTLGIARVRDGDVTFELIGLG